MWNGCHLFRNSPDLILKKEQGEWLIIVDFKYYLKKNLAILIVDQFQRAEKFFDQETASSSITFGSRIVGVFSETLINGF